jgi:hypothetical protein
LVSDGLHQPVLCHDQSAKGVSTVVTMTNISGIQGTHAGEPVATVRYERAWKQRPGVVTLALGAFVNLGASPTDNNTGVSAVRCRHLQ